MSSAAVAIALNHSRAKGTARLVLIGIAEHEGEGGSWPSLRRLARYCAGDRRQVQRALEKLEELGEIRKHLGEGGTLATADYFRPNLYEFLLTCPHDCDRSAAHNTEKDRTDAMLGGLAPRRSHNRPPGGHTTAPPAVTQPRGEAVTQPPEPSIEPLSEEDPEVTTDRAREALPCNHPRIPDDGRCLYACDADFEYQRRLKEASA